MEKIKRVWSMLSDEEVELIGEAARKERRSRASFMAVAALERAAQLIKKTGA